MSATRDRGKPAQPFTLSIRPTAPVDVGAGGVQLWPMRHVLDQRGNLIPVEFERELPFLPRRQFFIHDVSDDSIRGEHAHRICHQFLFAVVASLSVIVDDGREAREVELNRASFGLYLPPYVWSVQYRFTPHTVLSVYASHPYDASEYIRDYDEFLAETRVRRPRRLVEHLVTRGDHRGPAAAPRYEKPRRVTGHKLALREARPADAPFILGLRTDPNKARFLSATSSDVARQVAWLEACGRDDSQVYFIMEDAQRQPVGTVRLYDARGDSFCWGSWIIKDGMPTSYAIESALMVYRYALGLGFTRAHFEVRKDNASVCRFHERFGAVRTGEAEQEFRYSISGEAIAASLEKYARYLPEGIRIER